MSDELGRFTSDRRNKDGASWKGEADWLAGTADNVNVVDGALVSQRLTTTSELPTGEVSFTGIWDAGEEPTTGGNLVDGNADSGVTDGEMHDNNYQEGSVSAQILVQYEDPQDWASIAYDVQIAHNGSTWNDFGHELSVSDGSSWEQIDSWSGNSNGDVSTQNSEPLPFEQVHAVELDITVSGGRGSSEWITAFIDYYNFQLLE